MEEQYPLDLRQEVDLERYRLYLLGKKVDDAKAERLVNYVEDYYRRGYSVGDFIGSSYDRYITLYEEGPLEAIKEEVEAIESYWEYAGIKPFAHKLMVSYGMGYSSFVPKGLHPTGYTLSGRTLTISYKDGFSPSDEKKTFTLNKGRYLSLLRFIESYEEYLSPGGKLLVGFHGPISTMDYRFDDHEEYQCKSLFTVEEDGELEKKLNARFWDYLQPYWN